MDLTGKKVLVTGGAVGLGQAICQKFHDAGVTVFAIDKDEEALKKLKDEFPSIQTIYVDIVDWKGTKDAVEKAGPFNYLVNNAGVTRLGSILEVTEDDVDFVFGVNYKAALNVAQIFAKGVIQAKIPGASIVNISSPAASKAISNLSTYACSKAALAMMTTCLAKELGPHGIRVNAIRPSTMVTPMCMASFAKLGLDSAAAEASLLDFMGDAPIKRILEPWEAAELVLFLCTNPAAGMITGESVAIDGGYGLA